MIDFLLTFCRSLRRTWRERRLRPATDQQLGALIDLEEPDPLREAAPLLLAACEDALRVLDDPRCAFQMPHTKSLLRAAVDEARGRAKGGA